MMRNAMRPPIAYPKIIDGPADCMTCADPKNKPVPIAPPMAIN